MDTINNRREFLRLISLAGAAALAPKIVLAEPLPGPQLNPLTESRPDPQDPYHPRFGVWVVQHHIKLSQFWVRCDCGVEEEIDVDSLLGVNALACNHVWHHFLPANPEHANCVCGKTRRWFFNARGKRIFRCGRCEQGDILNFLRYNYAASSAQFTTNMERQQRKKFNFSIRKEDRETKERVSYAEYRRRQRDYERTQWAALTATEQAAAWQRRETYLWSHFLEMDKKWVDPIAGYPRCGGYRPLAPSWPSHFDCVCGTFVILDRWLPDDVERITMKTPEELEDFLKSQRS